MNWVTLLILGALLAAIFGLKRLALISAVNARRMVREGAAIIDVRTPAEYHERHLSAAQNVPLDRLQGSIRQAVPDKNRTILLHCLSGGRSGLARVALKRMGYTRAYNLGSYRRAEKILRT
jgi:phage shock protein E